MTKKKTDDTLDLTPAKREELRNAFMQKGIKNLTISVEATLLRRATDAKSTPEERQTALQELWGFRTICNKVLVGDIKKRIAEAEATEKKEGDK